ncbi:MAG: hypothetical protein KAS52_04730 [Candidatus Heimdallarchaeota archaeon]|nr:hypothetical protein [Candidatus Heimdallarchaeota archaeon]
MCKIEIIKSNEKTIIYKEVTIIDIATIERRFIELIIDFTLFLLYLCHTTVTNIAIIIESKNKVYPRNDIVYSIVVNVKIKLINIPTARIRVNPTAIDAKNGGEEELIFSYNASTSVPHDQQIRVNDGST